MALSPTPADGSESGMPPTAPRPGNSPVSAPCPSPYAGTTTARRMSAPPPSGDWDGEAPCFPGPGHGLRDRSSAVPRRRGLRLRSRTAAVHPQFPHLRRPLRHRGDDRRRTVPVPHVGRVNLDRGREPLHIHRGVALPALDPLARVVSRRAARLRRLHRPAAGRGRRRRRGAPRPLPRRIAQRVHHALQNAVVAPRVEVVPNRRKGGRHPGIARHRHPVAGMYRIASKTVRRPTVRRRPCFDRAGRGGLITHHFPSVRSLSYRSGPRLYFSRVVPFQAMRPSPSRVQVGGEIPHLREAIHILGQPLRDANHMKNTTVVQARS